MRRENHVRLVDDYPWLVMVDRGNGLELGAWYDNRDDAEKEVEFQKSQGRRAELRRNGGKE